MGPNYAIIWLEMKLGIKISIREGCSRGSCPSPSQQLVVREIGLKRHRQRAKGPEPTLSILCNLKVG